MNGISRTPRRKVRAAVWFAVAPLSVLGASQACAQSSVTLYGQVDVFLGAVKPYGADRKFTIDAGGIQTSYWGIKGTEELSTNLKAIFDLNGFLNADNGTSGRFSGDSFFSRNSYVGLQDTRYGTVKVGRNTTPYFISTILFNPLIDSFVFAPTVLQTYLGAPYASNGGTISSGIIGDTGYNNAILYSTPVMGGFSANALYALGEQAGSLGSSKWGGNVVYFGQEFSATVAFQQVRFNTNPVADTGVPSGFRYQSAVTAGAAYDFKIVKAFAQGQYIKNSITSDDVTTKQGQAGISIPIGAGSLLASFAFAKTTGGPETQLRKTGAIAYDYNLSKRTDLYVAGIVDEVGNLSLGTTFGLGIRTKF